MQTRHSVLMGDDWELLEGLETNLPNCNFIESSALNTIKGDKILGLNVRGLRANQLNLQEFMNSLNNPQEIKVIALTEVFNADHRDKDNLRRTYSPHI